MPEAEFYCVRCRYGKIEIEVESSDRDYVDQKLDELLRTFPMSTKKKKGDLAASEKPTPGEKSALPAVPPPKKAAPPPKKAAPPPKKAAPPPKKAAPKAAEQPPATAASKRAVAAPSSADGINPQFLAEKIRTHAGFAKIQKHVLRQPSQLPRVMLCHYFAEKLGAQGLTANQVEAITDHLGVRIASPNVAKVIRQQAKKYFASDRNGGVTRHRINRAGLAAVEQLLAG